MQQLRLSVFNYGNQANQQTVLMRSLLDTFEHEQHIHVDLEVLDWSVALARLVEIAIYGRGPDVSQVGSTWVMDLAGMNALQSLSPLEMKPIGSEKDFVPANWNVCTTPSSTKGVPVVWAIPWSADVRMVFYRRDFLEQAKIDPTCAFEHIDAVDQTLAKLKTYGHELPVSLSTLRSYNSIYHMASWVWDSGGDFMTPDGKHVAFGDPRALRGMSYYFGLGQYIPIAQHQKILDHEADRLFISGQAGAVFSGPWILGELCKNPAVNATVGVAPMPGASFVGGSHMVIWKHSQKKEAALALLDFLVKRSMQHGMFPLFNFPAYLRDWNATRFLEEPYFSAFRNTLQKGRSFPASKLWVLVEKHLADVVPPIWEKILNANHPDIGKILAETIVPLAQQLDMSLKGY
jgi:multiple sugar transport system substrate-binding protein